MIVAGIEYDAAGEGPPVLCLHGIGGGTKSFRPQLDDAAHTIPDDPDRNSAANGLGGFRLMAWNMPGYGDSVATVWPPSFQSLSETLGDFVDALETGPVHLVGQSIGGMIALEHALRRPDQVTSIVLIGTTPSFGGRDESFGKTFLNARLAPLDAGLGMAGMAREAAPGLVGPSASKEVIADVEQPLAAVPETTWRGILECLVTFNRRDDLARVTQPCCLIAGGHDTNAPARTMERMAAGLPRAHFHVIETASHMVNQESPTEVNRIIGEFLRSHNP